MLLPIEDAEYVEGGKDVEDGKGATKLFAASGALGLEHLMSEGAKDGKDVEDGKDGKDVAFHPSEGFSCFISPIRPISPIKFTGLMGRMGLMAVSSVRHHAVAGGQLNPDMAYGRIPCRKQTPILDS